MIAALNEVHRYVPVGRAMDYVRLGWVPLPTFKGTVHQDYSVHMMWRCCCNREVVEPRRAMRPVRVRPVRPVVAVGAVAWRRR